MAKCVLCGSFCAQWRCKACAGKLPGAEQYNFNVDKAEGRRINAEPKDWAKLERMQAEYTQFGNRHRFSEAWKRHPTKEDEAKFALDMAVRIKRRKLGAKKERDLTRLGRAKGQTHMGDFQ